MSDAFKPTVKIVTTPSAIKTLVSAHDRALDLERARAQVLHAIEDAKEQGLFREDEAHG